MNINFLKLFRFNFMISCFFCILSFILIFFNRFNLGLEFVGGLELDVCYKHNIEINAIKNVFLDFKDVKVKKYGSKNTFQIRIKENYKKNEEIINLLKSVFGDNIIILRIDYIGAEITRDIISKSLYALFFAIFIMSFYLFIRFDYKFSLSAILALFHDILIVLGVISFFNFELNLTVISALFAVFGYSVNDTIIIFDRLRENMLLYSDRNLKELINLSINNTLSRTLVTSFSTLFVVFIILIFSSDYLFVFSFVLFLGIAIGTYSSIYIASFLFMLLNR